MIQLTREDSGQGLSRIGTQPIALAAATLVAILAAVVSIALWRVYTGTSPELDRSAVARQLQARAAQVSEQLIEKTRGLEVSQQESIDQLQMMQDQLQQVRKQLAAQQADSKRLSEQITSLTEAISGLRESFASAQSSEPSSPEPSPHRALRARAHASRGSHGSGKSRG
jgi:flagellar motility protein MotE (MotC chaperone)